MLLLFFNRKRVGNSHIHLKKNQPKNHCLSLSHSLTFPFFLFNWSVAIRDHNHDLHFHATTGHYTAAAVCTPYSVLCFVLFWSIVSRDWTGDDSSINSSHMSTEGHNTLVHREPSESLSQPLRPALVLRVSLYEYHHSVTSHTMWAAVNYGVLS